MSHFIFFWVVILRANRAFVSLSSPDTSSNPSSQFNKVMLTPKLPTSETLPKAMMWSVYLSSVLGSVTVLTMCFALGDLNSILASSTGYPFIQIYYNATQNYSGTNFMVAIPIILLICACIAEIATASRQLWSFARDKGPPFSTALARVSPHLHLYLNLS